MQSSPAPHHVLPVRSKYSPQHPVLKLCSSHSVKPSFTPIQNNKESMVLYILIFKLLWEEGGRQKTEQSGSKHSLNINCSLFLHECNFDLYCCYHLLELGHIY
jgi:hypothetical protein